MPMKNSTRGRKRKLLPARERQRRISEGLRLSWAQRKKERGMSVSKDAFDFESIHYPAFIVVAGGSKHTISSHNRSEWEEHFASDVCQDAAAARRLMDGYRG